MVAMVDAAIQSQSTPPVLAAHSLGCSLVAQWAKDRGGRGVVGAFLVAPSDVEAPGYPVQEFWAPRLYRLHKCHEPRSVSVYAPSRCDVAPNFVPVGPYCGGSQPHFPIGGTAHP